MEKRAIHRDYRIYTIITHTNSAGYTIHSVKRLQANKTIHFVIGHSFGEYELIHFRQFKQFSGGFMNSLARSLLLSLLASFLIFGCCERTTGPSSLSLLSVDAQSNFQNDVVKVEIDDHVFFEDTLMTDFSLGLAYSKQTYVATGAHRIRVAIPSQSAQKEFHVTVKDTLTVGIHYNRSTNELDYSTYNFILRYR